MGRGCNAQSSSVAASTHLEEPSMRLRVLAATLIALAMLGIRRPGRGGDEWDARRDEPPLCRLRGQPGLRVLRDPSVADRDADGGALLQRQHLWPRHQHDHGSPPWFESHSTRTSSTPPRRSGPGMSGRTTSTHSSPSEAAAGFRVSTPTTSRSSSSVNRAARSRRTPSAPTSAARCLRRRRSVSTGRCQLSTSSIPSR